MGTLLYVCAICSILLSAQKLKKLLHAFEKKMNKPAYKQKTLELHQFILDMAKLKLGKLFFSQKKRVLWSLKWKIRAI